MVNSWEHGILIEIEIVGEGYGYEAQKNYKFLF